MEIIFASGIASGFPDAVSAAAICARSSLRWLKRSSAGS